MKKLENDLFSPIDMFRVVCPTSPLLGIPEFVSSQEKDAPLSPEDRCGRPDAISNLISKFASLQETDTSSLPQDILAPTSPSLFYIGF